MSQIITRTNCYLSSSGKLYLSTVGISLKLRPTVCSVLMDDYSYFLRKEAEITAIWQRLKLAQRSMYKIQA